MLCGLPVRQPPKGQLLFERRNGRFLLQITGHPQYGLPFGQDRLVPIYLATLAVRQKSPTVRFRSGAAMLETFGMQKEGKEYRRLVAAFERIFGATIFFGTDTMSGKAKLVERTRFHFLREARIWYHRRPEQPVLSSDFENVIVLSVEFYGEITAHPIPTDLEAVKVLASTPAVLDLFLWLSYRCFLATTEEAIPLFGTFGLAQQLGSVEYSRPRRFRAKLAQWLDTIRLGGAAFPIFTERNPWIGQDSLRRKFGFFSILKPPYIKLTTESGSENWHGLYLVRPGCEIQKLLSKSLYTNWSTIQVDPII